jgi:hypothetical protein
MQIYCLQFSVQFWSVGSLNNYQLTVNSCLWIIICLVITRKELNVVLIIQFVSEMTFFRCYKLSFPEDTYVVTSNLNDMSLLTVGRACLMYSVQFHNNLLRHYATSRKVAGSIPYEVIGFWNWPNPSSRTMILGSTQPLTEISTRNFSGG